MPFLTKAPDPPNFLGEITDEEFRRHGSIRRTFDFNSKCPGSRNNTQSMTYNLQSQAPMWMWYSVL